MAELQRGARQASPAPSSPQRAVPTHRSPPSPGRTPRVRGCSTRRSVDGRSVYAPEAADAARILCLTGHGGASAIHAGRFDGETGSIRFAPDGERSRRGRQQVSRRRRGRPAGQLISNHATIGDGWISCAG